MFYLSGARVDGIRKGPYTNPDASGRSARPNRKRLLQRNPSRARTNEATETSCPP